MPKSQPPSGAPSAADSPTWGPLRSFGRIKSRTLKPAQAALFETLLPTIAIPEEGPLDPVALMPGARAAWIEIGFGGGEHMASLEVVIVSMRRPWPRSGVTAESLSESCDAKRRLWPRQQHCWY